jgi:hypothetical protein
MIDIAKVLNEVDWYRKQPAKPEVIQNLENEIKGLPKAYLSFLLYSDGGEGKINLGPGWFHIWSSIEVIALNKGYEIGENIPGFFGFGSSGGSELLAFDMRKNKKCELVMIPFIPMSEEKAISIAKDFEEFIWAIGKDL